MNKEERKVPELRFKGFHDDWEQRKFKELVDRVSDSSENMNLPRVEYEDIISDRGKLNKDLSLKISDKKGTKFLPKDILFGKLRPYLNKWLHPNFNGIAVGDFWVLRSKEVESKFIFYILQTEQFKLISNISSGSKMPRSDWNIVSNSMFSVPLNLSEDKKISLLLSTIENLITLHQKKINTITLMKQSFLRVMFPQRNSISPKLRFHEFKKTWEQCNLKELLTPSKIKNNSGKYNQNDILAASLGTELVKKHIFYGLRSTKDSIKNYRVVTPGDVIYTKSPIKGYPNGIIRSNKGLHGIVPSLYCVYQPKVRINSHIIQTYFEDKSRLDEYLYPLVNVGARNNVNITDTEFLEGQIKIPKEIEEQNKIVIFYRNLANVIEFHRRKINNLEKLKKVYLNKMFL